MIRQVFMSTQAARLTELRKQLEGLRRFERTEGAIEAVKAMLTRYYGRPV